jgi:hypothetical protein
VLLTLLCMPNCVVGWLIPHVALVPFHVLFAQQRSQLVLTSLRFDSGLV